MATTALHTTDRLRAEAPEALEALFDESGFLRDPALWTEELAERLAWEAGLGALTEPHWRVIRYLRARFHALGGIPSMHRVCRDTGLSREAIHQLFGSCFRVWRIAGLPDPGEEAKAYM
ncbi:sulfur relay protein DsrC [Thioalkalivibrio denitrificans]|uniref:Sulfur relay protein DsrC n=1 Tax=Thioalkalivibrio denitrificans TaxID=108003 RepID=A0A1V3NSB5_9GAMM|nr:TusE/DsrC/DsvC family sulfur relay protein [Thioalkalivibrio denitrificans]OOG27853.1 sulfur relay protein DsrC [Thioalkalivibrio denitrificans]